MKTHQVFLFFLQGNVCSMLFSFRYVHFQAFVSVKNIYIYILYTRVCLMQYLAWKRNYKRLERIYGWSFLLHFFSFVMYMIMYLPDNILLLRFCMSHHGPTNSKFCRLPSAVVNRFYLFAEGLLHLGEDAGHVKWRASAGPSPSPWAGAGATSTSRSRAWRACWHWTWNSK